MTHELEYPRYVKEYGSYYLVGNPYSSDRKRIIFMTDTVSIAFELTAGTALLLKHGEPTAVQAYVSDARKKFLDAGHEELAVGIRYISLPADFDVDELNHTIHTSGYLTVILRKFYPDALILPVSPISGNS